MGALDDVTNTSRRLADAQERHEAAIAAAYDDPHHHSLEEISGRSRQYTTLQGVKKVLDRRGVKLRSRGRPRKDG